MPSLRERLQATGKRFYCICFTIRSGSTLLRDDLAQWHLGAAHEYFQPQLYYDRGGSAADYVLQVVDQSHERHVGFKITWDQLTYLAAALDAQGEPVVDLDLRTVFPDLVHLYVVRNDKIGQAVSAWRAATSGTWHWPAGTDVDDPGHPPYDFRAIVLQLKQILLDELLWSLHFGRNRIPYRRIDYEEYVRKRSQELKSVAYLLGARPPRITLHDRTRIMRDDWSQQIVRRFVADLGSPGIQM